MHIGVKLVHPCAKAPEKATSGSAGYDLFAVVQCTVPPARTMRDGGVEVGRALIPTGIVLSLPIHTVGRLASRSGLSVKSNVEVGAGWIDRDYRGEVMVELKNLSSTPYSISPGERIAQLIILPLSTSDIQIVDEVDETGRGSDGFGSTESR